ncbi:halovibrin HvnC [Pseudomonas sp. S2_E02]
MRQIIGFILIAVLFGCSQDTRQLPAPTITNIVQSIDGPAIAARLSTLYDRKYANCNNSNSQPAFLCSGVIIRVTVKDPDNKYKVWEPSPTSVKQGMVTFSYLRADSNIARFAYGYNNGYILFPIFEAPTDKLDQQILCSYPYDAWSHTRGYTPCAAHASYPAQSQLCQNAGVTTAEQWYEVWKVPGGSPNQRQCGFDVRDERNALAGPAFYQSIRARGLPNPRNENHNEIQIKTWCDPTSANPATSCKQSFPANRFPIMAFFYLNGSAGLADAQYNQRDFYNSTNPKVIVPIIRLTLASSGTIFTYIQADQVILQ